MLEMSKLEGSEGIWKEWDHSKGPASMGQVLGLSASGIYQVDLGQWSETHEDVFREVVALTMPKPAQTSRELVKRTFSSPSWILPKVTLC